MTQNLRNVQAGLKIWFPIKKAYIYIIIVQNIVKKIKEHLRNHQAENDPKFKKRPGWPKNLVSYKKSV